MHLIFIMGFKCAFIPTPMVMIFPIPFLKIASQGGKNPILTKTAMQAVKNHPVWYHRALKTQMFRFHIATLFPRK